MISGYSAVCIDPAPDDVFLLLGLNSNCSHSRSNEMHQTKNPEAVIGLELSSVPEIELVFVDLVQKQKTVRVISVINERNADVRARIYAQEQSIMNEFPALDFSFRILTRMNRNLGEMVEPVGKLAYRR